MQSNPLITFTNQYINCWQTKYQHEPKSEQLYGIPSPCITKTKDGKVYWLPIPADERLTFHIIEEVMNIKIHPSAWHFYCTQYAGDMQANFNGTRIELIQVWDQHDFSRLEQNLIAHLSMQKKRKKRPTIFIATTSDDSELITIDNQTGEVMLENLIDSATVTIAVTLESFLETLIPIAQ